MSRAESSHCGRCTEVSSHRKRAAAGLNAQEGDIDRRVGETVLTSMLKAKELAMCLELEVETSILTTCKLVSEPTGHLKKACERNMGRSASTDVLPQHISVKDRSL